MCYLSNELVDGIGEQACGFCPIPATEQTEQHRLRHSDRMASRIMPTTQVKALPAPGPDAGNQAQRFDQATVVRLELQTARLEFTQAPAKCSNSDPELAQHLQSSSE